MPLPCEASFKLAGPRWAMLRTYIRSPTEGVESGTATVDAPDGGGVFAVYPLRGLLSHCNRPLNSFVPLFEKTSSRVVLGRQIARTTDSKGASRKQQKKTHEEPVIIYQVHICQFIAPRFYEIHCLSSSVFVYVYTMQEGWGNSYIPLISAFRPTLRTLVPLAHVRSGESQRHPR